jgi:hypothetical protein
MLFQRGVFVIICFKAYVIDLPVLIPFITFCLQSRSDLFPTSAAERTQDPCQTVPKWFDYHLGYRYYRICDHFPMDRSRCVLLSRVLFPARPKKVKKKPPFLCHHVSCAPNRNLTVNLGLGIRCSIIRSCHEYCRRFLSRMEERKDDGVVARHVCTGSKSTIFFGKNAPANLLIFSTLTVHL